MKAWVCHRFTKPFEMKMVNLPVPEPGAGEIRIRVRAAGLAFGETLVMEGAYQKTPPLPYIPCSEMAGIVDVSGSGVEKYTPGDAVAAFSFSLQGGGLAEYCVLPAEYVQPLPAGLSFADGAGFLMNYWTAFNALFRRAALQPGEVLVVHGATGGVGSAALAVGKAIGATVVATGSDDDRLVGVKADHVINHLKTDLREALLSLTSGRGADVFFDPVGGDIFDQSLRAIAPGGRILVVGFASGIPVQLRANVILVKMISVIGVEARLAIEERGSEGVSDFKEMLRWAEEGKFRPQTRKTFSFDQAPEGFRYLLDRKHVGKCAVLIE